MSSTSPKPQPPAPSPAVKKAEPLSLWITVGIPVGLVVLIAAVVAWYYLVHLKNKTE
jgi:hypothetical protein